MKYAGPPSRERRNVSHPPRGAWVEIASCVYKNTATVVAPPAGCVG